MNLEFPWTDSMLAVFGRLGRAPHHGATTPTDLTVALLDQPDGNAPTWWRAHGFSPRLALTALGVDPAATVTPAREVGFDEATRNVLRTAATVAARARAHHVGTEHLLAALVNDETVGPVFQAQGITPHLVATYLHDLDGAVGVEHATPRRRRRSLLAGALGVALLLILALCLLGPFFF